MKKAIIKLGYECNNSCIICHSDELRKKYKPSSLKDIKIKILVAKKKGYSFVLFSGGEPTIRKDLLQIASFVQKQKMSFGLITNGRMLSYEFFLKTLIKYNLKYVYFSLLGSKPEIHNKISGANSFKETVEGIKNVLKKPSIEYLINVTVIKSNLDDLLNIVDLAYSIGAKRIKFSFVDIKGSIKEKNSFEVPKISLAAEKVREAMDYAIEKKIEPFFDGFPNCFMGSYYKRINNLFTNKILLTSEAYEADFFKTDNFNKTKPEICDTCEFFRSCSGLEKEYIGRFGSNELTPFKKISNSAPFFLYDKFSEIDKISSNDWRKIFVKNDLGFLGYSYESSDFNREDINKIVENEQVYVVQTGNYEFKNKKHKKIGYNLFVSDERDVFSFFDNVLTKELKKIRGCTLDIGCGEIRYKQLFKAMVRNKKIQYEGIDPFKIEESIEELKIKKSTFEEYVSQNDFYDNILLLGSYNHLLDVPFSISKIKKYLKNGGLCIISDSEPCIVLKEKSNNSNKKEEFEHYRNESLEKVKALLEKFKFRIIKEIPVTKDTANMWVIIASNIKV